MLLFEEIPFMSTWRLPYYQVNAFVDQWNGGNPAGVVLLQDWLSESVLQAVAAENDLAETSFVVKKGNHWDIRWFTPTVEVDLCGHATLGAAAVLFELHPEVDSFDFHSKSGVLTSWLKEGRHHLRLPRWEGEIQEVQPLERILGLSIREARKSRDLMIVLETEEEVFNFSSSIETIAGLEGLGLIVTAPGRETDFVSRFFAPKAGIAEDPVTGSAHCTLVPYWADRLQKRELSARQLSARGGRLWCKDLGSSVELAGECWTYFRGTLQIPS
jgi:PhzF family phenazine biosynthesis protein